MKPDKIGSFTFVLHSHIPYVLAHGRWPHGMDWLSEVTAETYVPLLEVFDRLASEGISANVTIGLTPVLAEQLADETFQYEFEDYLRQKIGAAKMNQEQFRHDGNMHMLGLSHFWQDYYGHILDLFLNTYNKDLLGAFRRLQDAGHIEIVTSAATHGYLPLIGTDACIQAQVKQGVQSYVRHFGRMPSGFWLPECAYRPRYAWKPPVGDGRKLPPVLRKGVEEFLAENGLQYFFVDSHLLKGGETIGVYAERFKGLQELWTQFQKGYQPEIAERSPYQPYLVNSSGQTHAPVAIFSRDHQTGMQVWSGENGYPGDEYYLEFHKKHYPGNLRFWRVSQNKQDLGSKELYQPHIASERVQVHATHFVKLIHKVLQDHNASHNTPGFITAMYDTELFGHWWFEGPEFIYQVIKRLHEAVDIEKTTCAGYLQTSPPSEVISLPEGSWGEGGYHWIWLNEWTVWTWEKIYPAEERMTSLVRKYENTPGVETLLKQAGRELLLLESSDWQFSISTFSSRDYAEERVKYHLKKFHQIADLVEKRAAGIEILPEEWNFLGEAEDRDRCFPDVQPSWWADVEFPATAALPAAEETAKALSSSAQAVPDVSGR